MITLDTIVADIEADLSDLPRKLAVGLPDDEAIAVASAARRLLANAFDNARAHVARLRRQRSTTSFRVLEELTDESI